MGNARVNLKGLQDLSVNAYKEVKDAVNENAQDLAKIARTKTAPVDKGDLRRSISAEAEFIFDQAQGGKLRVAKRVVAAEDYAFAQHEGDFKHPKGGQQYYLTGPLAERNPLYLARMGAAVARAVKNSAMK